MSLRSLAVLVVLAVGLSGCTASAPAPTSSPTTVATPKPAVESNGAATLQVTSEKLIALDASGEVIAEADYFGDGADAIALLTSTFADRPLVEDLNGNPHALTTTQYHWDGVRVLVFDYGTDLGYEAPAVYLAVRVTEVEGVKIITGDGIAIGASEADVKPYSYGYQDVQTVYLLDEFRVDVQYFIENGLPAYSTHVDVDEAGEVIAISAPDRNFGP